MDKPVKTQNIAGLVAVVAIIAISSVAMYYFAVPNPQNRATTTTTLIESSVVTDNPAPYFPTGHYSKAVNFSEISSGDNLSVGHTTFLFQLPSNIEVWTTTLGGVSTVITVTADYQCGISLGARRFFFAELENGNSFKLDYCLLLNTAAAMVQRSNNYSMSWNLWQISINTSPTVAIHMEGRGIEVDLTELWAASYESGNSTTTGEPPFSTSSISGITSTGYPGNYDAVCREEGYAAMSTDADTTLTYSCTTFNRSTGTAGEWAYQLLGISGTLNMSGIGDFAYFRMNGSTPESFQFQGVEFSLITNLTSIGSGTACYPNSRSWGYALTFPDGSLEKVSSCITIQQNSWELHLSHHSPPAGFLILSNGTLYFLVGN